jgi:hypothetical protein
MPTDLVFSEASSSWSVFFSYKHSRRGKELSFIKALISFMKAPTP